MDFVSQFQKTEADEGMRSLFEAPVTITAWSFSLSNKNKWNLVFQTV